MTPPSDDDGTLLADDPLWYKDAIIYEIPIRAYYDRDGDGIGDFPGLIDKLDYVHDLGVTAIWVLPFYPSPQRDGGYDIADYRTIDPTYGTMADFRRFVREAHRRGIRVITELVINHTSIDHPWFQRARRSPPGSRHRDFYVWTDDPEKYPGVRIIFQDFETSNWTWDPVAKAYYWHRFYHHQPDLNFDHPPVRQAILKLLDFWFDTGVDAMRLDAIPYLYEREGTNCENLPETHAFLKELRAHVDRRFKNKMFLAEANQWPEDAAAYFGDGDECHMNFHFPLMPRMFMAVQLESSFPVLDIMAQTPKIPDACQWAIFLRNHDELTLEMVTDEDRDYMYRVYAEDPRMRINLGIRRRLAPLLKERAKAELMTSLLFSMPGTPVLYYGDEIGMGDNIYLGDRDSVRTPMQWSGDRNAGFSTANPQKLYLPTIIDPEYHYNAVNVEAQQANTSSLLWWTRRLIALRKRHRAFGRGEIAFLHPDNGKILAFVRSYEDEKLLVVANLSRTPQYVELDLSGCAGLVPVEMISRQPFPAIGERPYFLTLGPYGFYWFSLEPPAGEGLPHHEPPRLDVTGSWERVLGGRAREHLQAALRSWMRERRWFRGKSRRRPEVTIIDQVPLETRGGVVQVLLCRVDYQEGPSETYVVPVAFAADEAATELASQRPGAVIARVRVRPRRDADRDEAPGPQEGVLYDGVASPALADALLHGFVRRREPKGGEGSRLVFRPRKGLAGRLRGRDLTPHVATAEQSNNNIVYGETVILKLLRVAEPGTHPEEEMGRYLTDRRQFPHVPSLEGVVELDQGPRQGAVVAVLQELVRAQGDAWSVTLDAVTAFLDRARETRARPPRREPSLLARADAEIPEEVADVAGAYLPLSRQLGRRTAELHLSLAAELEDPDFTPEPLTLLYQRSLYQAARQAARQTFATLRRSVGGLPDEVAAHAHEVLGRVDALDERLRRIHDHRIEALRTRTHGDLHLGQVLYTSRDFVFIDFEGEPLKSLGERRFKRSPVRDVAGLLRSFRYAAGAAIREGRVAPEEREHLEPWLQAWADWNQAAFLGAWLDGVRGTGLVPDERGDVEILTEHYLLEKCVYEIGYELDNRPDWLEIPLRDLLLLLEA